MKKITLFALVIFSAIPAFAQNDKIVRPYWSVRTSAMGGVRITTGQYDENFFGNPARVTQNPTWRVQLPDPMVEANSTLLSNLSTLSSSDLLSALGANSGKNYHTRLQMTFPSIYMPDLAYQKRLSLAVGVLTSIQADALPGNAYQLDTDVFSSISLALNVGYRLLDEGELSLGLTPHFSYRATTKSTGFGLVDIFRGLSLSPANLLGDSGIFDADFGATYDLPWEWNEFTFTAGAAFNNLFNSSIRTGLNVLAVGSSPRVQPLTAGLGINAYRKSLWVFEEALFALEVTDINNNGSGSFFRLLHIGGEVDYGVLKPRLGINQGYLTAGLGVDLKSFELSLSSYGEELALNSGKKPDRIYALRLDFRI